VILNQTEIVKKCLKGDERAFKTLYDAFSGKMLVVCKRYTRETAEAEDLLQEGFMKVFEQLKTFRLDGILEKWIYRIMVNNAIDSFRKNVKIKTTDITELNGKDIPFVSADEILGAISSEELLLIIQDLSPQYRIIFNLYVFEGYKYHEIADRLKISEGTVKSNLFDARRILKEKVMKAYYIKDNHTRQTT